MEENIYPKARTAAVIISGENVLLGEVKRGAENGAWMFPWHEIGFRNNYYKNFFTGLWEDLGFRCTNVFIPYSDRQKPMAVTNDIFQEEHYITLFHRGIYTLGRSTIGSKNREKYNRFNWFKWTSLEQALNDSNKNLLNQNKDNKAPTIPYPLSQSVKNFLQQGYSPWKDLNIPETLKTKEC